MNISLFLGLLVSTIAGFMPGKFRISDIILPSIWGKFEFALVFMGPIANRGYFGEGLDLAYFRWMSRYLI